MNKSEIELKLNELKGCEKICIVTNEGLPFEINQTDIINNSAHECLLINATNLKDKKVFLYCSIRSILPV